MNLFLPLSFLFGIASAAILQGHVPGSPSGRYGNSTAVVTASRSIVALPTVEVNTDSSSSPRCTSTGTAKATKTRAAFPTVEVNTILGGEVQQRVVRPTLAPLIVPEMMAELDDSGNRHIPPIATVILTTRPGPAGFPTPSPVPRYSKAKNGKTFNPQRAGFTRGIFSGIFDKPISTNEPLRIYQRNSSHPLTKYSSDTHSMPTNKFMTNMMVGTRTHTVYVLPYQMRINNGLTATKLFGMTVSHTNEKQRFFGPNATETPVQYYVNPSTLEDIVLGAAEFKVGSSTFDLVDTTDLSATAVLATARGKKALFPMCQGMGFVTGLYDRLHVRLQTGQGFVTTSSKLITPGVTRHQIELNDGKIWLVYMTRTLSDFKTLDPSTNLSYASLVNQWVVHGAKRFTGIVQVAKFSDGFNTEELKAYDNAAGVYCTGVKLDGSVNGDAGTGSYSLEFKKSGVHSRPLLMFALPHHQQALTTGIPTSLTLNSPTKGMMRGIRGDKWVLAIDNVPVDFSFSPLRRDGRRPVYSATSLAIIRNTLITELSQNYEEQTNVESWYWGGKALDKLANLCFVASDILNDAALTNNCLTVLKKQFSRWQENKPKRPLAYDLVWKGLVSTHGYEDINQDYGNTGYNDHHFHYGYHVHAAATIAHLDPTWLTPTTKTYVEGLIRDFANPSSKDPYFTPNRAFDWWHGHSWAKGVWESADGKDQESSSEDYYAAYSLGLWAIVTKDTDMWARSMLMLGILRTSNELYFQILPDSRIHDPRFTPNIVTGILFEGKVDYATYFGPNPEFIHGIQMIPLSPVSPFMRSETFVKYEYETKFKGKTQDAVKGWQGILRANQALYDPEDALKFFTQSKFDMTWIDNGASLTYYLALIMAWIGPGA